MKRLKRCVALIATVAALSVSSLGVFASETQPDTSSPSSQMSITEYGNVPEARAYNAYVQVIGHSGSCYARSYSNVTAYMHSAMCEVNNNGQSVTQSAWSTLYNTTEVTSARVYASTSKCTYTAYGQSYHQSGGNLFSGQQGVSYG